MPVRNGNAAGVEEEAEAKSALMSAARRWRGLPDTTALARACCRAAQEVALDRKASLKATTRRHEAGNLRDMVYSSRMKARQLERVRDDAKCITSVARLSNSDPARHWPASDQDTHAPR